MQLANSKTLKKQRDREGNRTRTVGPGTILEHAIDANVIACAANRL
jgi:hypothetical protein